MKRKLVIAVIGGNTQTATSKDLTIAEEVGYTLIDNGYRILSGGLGGVMEAASRGGRSSQKHQNGDIVGVIPGLDTTEASPYCDIVIATGFHFARNQIITASADAVVAIGGGAGTLSEIAFAWQLGKPIYAFQLNGWSGKLGGKKLDNRIRNPIRTVQTVVQLIDLLRTDLLP